MSFWIFTVKNHKSNGREVAADEVLKQRLEDRFWGLGERTPNRTNLEENDQVVFYIGNPVKSFGGSATLASASFQLSKEEQDALSHGEDFYRVNYGVKLRDVQAWQERKGVSDLLPALDFIENKAYWGSYFQGGIRGIEKEDFLRIIDLEQRMSPPRGTIDEESASEFALEVHLEEFIDRNWEKVNFGSPLKKYEVEGQSGRQFPAGSWSIDFLCVDKTTGDFVVIELKRGQTSDATVGQILRYITYVRKNLARPDQSVRGLIVAKDADEALRLAVEGVSNVKILTYRVDFELRPIR